MKVICHICVHVHSNTDIANHRIVTDRVHDAGGKIAMGTDAGTPFNLHGENALELEFMVEIGIEPLDSLRFATRNGADLADLPDQGRIADGTAADFIVTEGNPAVDIAMAARKENHRMVVKRGVPVSADSLGLSGHNFRRMAAF